MKKTILFIFVVLYIPLLSDFNALNAQESISWLEDYTADVSDGSNTYNYSFSIVDDNDCKIKIIEKKTSKKGKVTTQSFIFYLNDVNPSALSFKTSGNNAVVTIEIKQSQKFILKYNEGELSGYISSISLNMSEVGKARSFIEAIKTNAEQCKETDQNWKSNKETIDWLSQISIESIKSGTSHKQSFSLGDTDYIVQLIAESTDSKGTQNTITYDVNLSDINPDNINLLVSGSYFKIVIPTRDNKNFIRLKQGNEEYSYSKSMDVFSDEMEQARKLFNAFYFLANNTQIPGRQSWDSYSSALDYVKENLGEVQVSSASIDQSLSFDNAASGMVHFLSEKTDSKGISTKETSSFYLSDLSPDINLIASTKNISFELLIKDKRKYIRNTSEDNVLPYSNEIVIYESNIEMARDVINAFENAISKSEDGIFDFTDTGKSIDWLSENCGDIKVDAENFTQTMQIEQDRENKIVLSVTTTSEGAEDVNEIFEIYPEDLSIENLEIKVTGKKMGVPLSTGKTKLIKTFKNDELQNYLASTEVLFDDVQKARNFIAAIKFLQENSQVKNRLMKDKESALAYLDEHVTKIELAGEVIEQKAEIKDDNDCQINITSSETDSKGATIEKVFEFTLSDIDGTASQLVVSMNKLMVNLVTKDKEKLIKPYKNGEEGNFINSIEIQVEDLLVAKKILGAFATLSKACE